MKLNRLTWTILSLMLLTIGAKAQEKYSKVKIYAPADNNARAQLIGLLNIDHFIPTKDGAIVSEISESDLKKLKSTSYQFQILVPDVASRIDSLNRIYYETLENNPQSRVAFEQPGSAVGAMITTPSAFQVKGTFGGYYSYTEMVAAIDALVLAYPAIAKKVNIATTVESRTVWAVKISDNVATDELNEPEVLYMGLQHAREAITGSSMIFFMQYLCERYAAGDTRIKNLVDNRELYIVPCFNPDGWEYNRTSMSGNAGGGWRKNRKVTSGTTYGVDLNRNWGIDWSNCSAPILGNAISCGTSDKTQDTYWGVDSFSEAETAGIKTFALAHHLVAGFDQHAYGPYYSLPFGRHSLHTMTTKGQNFYTAIPALMGNYNGMRAADSYDALGYEVAGGFKDWMFMGYSGGLKDTVWAMTGEGAAGGGTPAFGGYADFWAPASEIINLCKGMCYQNIQLAFAAGSYVDIQDATDMALTSLSGNFSFNIKRLGLGNDPVTVSVIPLENIADIDGPMTISSMTYYSNYTNTFGYTLYPNMTAGQRIKFAWKVQTGGQTYYDTIVKYYLPTPLLNDDMEGSFATNWTNTATGTPASGFGYNYTTGNWAFTASGGYNSTKALSESAAGTNYGTKSQKICQYNSVFNLTGATASYLTFMARYRAENFRDKCQVQVSTNGTTWTAIEGTTTVEEPGTLDDATINGQPSMTGIHDYWTPEVFDLSAYVGQAALRLRFVFTSDDDPSSFTFETDDGFYIDNVKVMKTNTPFQLLAVQFIDFTAQLQSNNTVKLNWEAVTDADHDYFMVERSSDGNNFTALGYGPQAAPYNFIDGKPVDGANYYRIRQVDKNGKFTYSKVRKVVIRQNYITSVFPNPVSDVLQIKMNNRQANEIKIELADMQGRVIYSNTRFVSENTSEIKVDMRSLVPQLYILKISNSQGEVLTTDKIIKR